MLVKNSKAVKSSAHLTAVDHFRPEQALPHAFAVVASRISSTLEKMYGQHFGLTVLGWRVIAILSGHSPLSAKALAELLATDQVSISRTVEQLVSKRLMTRRVDAADRRRVILRLTKKGEEIYNKIVPVLIASENALIADLCPEDVAALRRIMSILVDRSAEVLGDESNWENLLVTYGPKVVDREAKLTGIEGKERPSRQAVPE